MRFRVVITPSAEANLDEILRFIALDNPVAARKFVAGLRVRINTLATMPLRCPFAPENGVDGLELRHLIYRDYRIIFTLDKRRLIVLQIRHRARRTVAG